MKSLERKFQKLQKSDMGLGSYIIFARAVAGEGFSPNIIRQWFNRLVDKKEYSQSDKRALFAHLDALSNEPRSIEIGGQFTPRASSIHNSIS
jgi:hypothetical protein